jgi:hypothetical protein
MLLLKSRPLPQRPIGGTNRLKIPHLVGFLGSNGQNSHFCWFLNIPDIALIALLNESYIYAFRPSFKNFHGSFQNRLALLELEIFEIHWSKDSTTLIQTD